MPDNRPVDRLQAFLAAIAGDESAPELTPRDQMEYYLAKMAERIGNIQPGPSVLYPLNNGAADSGYPHLEITNGNHVHVYMAAGAQTSQTIFCNLHSCQIANTGSIINNKPALFTLPAGKEARLRIFNVVNGTSSSNRVSFALNVREANGNASGPLGTGNGDHSGGADVAATPNTDFAASCLFLYIDTLKLNSDLEFDVELTVDGQRWI